MQASDVYAFGVTLWELVSGEEAWLGLCNEAIINTVARQKTQLKFKDGHPAAYTVCSPITLLALMSDELPFELPPVHLLKCLQSNSMLVIFLDLLHHACGPKPYKQSIRTPA